METVLNRHSRECGNPDARYWILGQARNDSFQNSFVVLLITVSAAISDRAMQLIDAYALSHGLQLGYVLIAATAL